MKRNLLLAIFIFSVFSITKASNIYGIVIDNQTGERLIGASIYIKNNKQIGTMTGLDGSFVLKNLKSGNYTLVCSYISYKTIEKEIVVSKGSTSMHLNLNMDSYVNELSGVTIVSNDKTSDASVREMEKLSNSIINVVGARSIEISPDLTVANVLSRVSGVTLERNSSGEAEYAVLRGMDKRYNITLVNDMKIASPDSKQRYVPLSIFPSELLDRLEVIKTRNASTNGDATGGGINMVMKDAPSKFELRGNLALGYNDIFFTRKFEGYTQNNLIKTSPYETYGSNYNASISDFGTHVMGEKFYNPFPDIVAGFSLGNRKLDNKLGFVIAGNYQNKNRGINSTFFQDDMPQTATATQLTSKKERTTSENQQLYGLHAKLDYNLAKHQKISLYSFAVKQDAYQVRQTTGTDYSLNYNPTAGTMDLSYETRLRTTHQYVYAATLQGEHRLKEHWNLDWSVLHSGAGFNRPDETTVKTTNSVQSNVDHKLIDGDGSMLEWEHNEDQELSALLNSKYKLKIFQDKIDLQAGGQFRQEKKNNHYVSYTIKPIDVTQKYDNIDKIDWSVYNPQGSVGPLTYQASELIAAGYFQAKYERKKMETILGIRSEYTDQEYYMVHPNYGEKADGEQVYTDILPNVSLKYSPRKDINWRASYYKSISRPGYFEIVPYTIVGEEYTEYGNKDLKRTKIDNFDLRWEYFPKPTDQILIGAFYKNILSPIEMAYFSVNNRQFGYGLKNLGNAQNFGAEIDFIKYIRWFGVKANYTYTHSAITTSKVYYGKNESGDTETMYANQTRPLVGQAQHVANISLLYKDVHNGWNAQLAAAYTGEKIAIVSRFLNSDYWDKPTFNLDASIEKDFKNNIAVFAKINNLLNTPAERFIKTHNSYNDKFSLQSSAGGETIIKRDYYKQSFLIGIRYKL